MKRALGILFAALGIGFSPISATAYAQQGTVFEAPFDPGYCGDQLMRLYDGDFERFWNFERQQGFAAVPEFVWSVPVRGAETAEDWRARAYQCVLEIERANLTDDSVETRYSTGYLLWFGTPSIGFDKEPDGAPGIRERAYMMLMGAARDGSQEARVALLQVYVEMVRVIDRQNAFAGKSGATPTIPNWFPTSERVLVSLDRYAKTGVIPEAYLAVATIYSERYQLAASLGYDHVGRAVTAPDPRLEKAAEAYRKVWRDSQAQASAS